MTEVFEDIIAFCIGKESKYLNCPFCFQEPRGGIAPHIRVDLSDSTKELLTQEVDKVGIERLFILLLMANYYLDIKYALAGQYDQLYLGGLLKETYFEYLNRREQEKVIKKRNAEEARRVKENNHRWLIISPNGERREINNLREYCAAHDLKYPLMLAAAAGFQLTHRGYKVRKLAPG